MARKQSTSLSRRQSARRKKGGSIGVEGVLSNEEVIQIQRRKMQERLKKRMEKQTLEHNQRKDTLKLSPSGKGTRQLTKRRNQKRNRWLQRNTIRRHELFHRKRFELDPREEDPDQLDDLSHSFKKL